MNLLYGLLNTKRLNQRRGKESRTPFVSILRRPDNPAAVRKSSVVVPPDPRGAMVRVAQSKAPIDFEELEGSRPGSEGGLFLVPRNGWEMTERS